MTCLTVAELECLLGGGLEQYSICYSLALGVRRENCWLAACGCGRGGPNCIYVLLAAESHRACDTRTGLYGHLEVRKESTLDRNERSAIEHNEVLLSYMVGAVKSCLNVYATWGLCFLIFARGLVPSLFQSTAAFRIRALFLLAYRSVLSASGS